MAGSLLLDVLLENEPQAVAPRARPTDQSTPSFRRQWSSGATHGAKVSLGILRASLGKAEQVVEKLSADNLDLVRNVFGSFFATATAASISHSQNLALFRGPGGAIDCFDFKSQTHQSMARQKAVGIFSHVQSQMDGLLTFITSAKCKHAVVTIVADDTNIWVNSPTVSHSSTGEVRTKRGMKKMQALLGMLQCIFVREKDSDARHVLQLHNPSQLLPRANWATIASRMRRWCVYCSAGCAEPFGSTAPWAQMEEIPLKLIVMCNLGSGTNMFSALT